MLPIYTIASTSKGLKGSFQTDAPDEYVATYQARPNGRFPIIIPEHGMVMANWGINRSITVPMDTVLKKRPFNILIRTQRCVVPSNCFFGNRSGKVYLIKLAGERLFCFGGVFKYADGNYSFSMLTTEAADILKPHLHQMPLILKTERYYKWLEAAHLRRVMEYADRSAEHWFDLFEVDPKLMDAGAQNAALLKPLGLSNSQLKEREQMLNSLKLNEYRTQRSK